jgi:acetyltransferase-like isoleucine patch superfamily enzyme
VPIERSKVYSTVKIWHPELVNIYDSVVGEGTKIASFVEIGGAKIGKHCKIEAFAFIPPGTVIEDYVFIGPHVTITNDRKPCLLKPEWVPMPVVVKRGAVIGANSVIVAGVTIGEEALVGAGSVVTKDVPARAVVYGNPARIVRLEEAK